MPVVGLHAGSLYVSLRVCSLRQTIALAKAGQQASAFIGHWNAGSAELKVMCASTT